MLKSKTQVALFACMYSETSPVTYETQATGCYTEVTFLQDKFMKLHIYIV